MKHESSQIVEEIKKKMQFIKDIEAKRPASEYPPGNENPAVQFQIELLKTFEMYNTKHSDDRSKTPDEDYEQRSNELLAVRTSQAVRSKNNDWPSRRMIP